MTLATFVTKSAFRNKRRSLFTIISLGVSLFLLTFLLTLWKSFFIDKGAPDSALRIMTRHRTSLANFLPAYYRGKIRTIPGVTRIVPMTWFGGKYKDDKPENYFAQFATDPAEYMLVAADKEMPADQLAAWQHDRSGCIVDTTLAQKHGWKIGDHIHLQGNIFPTDLDLTLRGIYTIDPPSSNLYFDQEYLSQSVDWFKDTAGFYFIRTDSAESMPRVARAIDDEFHNAVAPTKSESEQAFKLDFVSLLGNVKVFILSITAAVVFTTLLVGANTMAMSIRERTREVAVLRTLGFTRQSILSLLLGESVTISILGGLLGLLFATLVMKVLIRPGMALPTQLKLTSLTVVVVMLVAALVGVISGLIPSYRASRVGIVDGLRHIG
jgi:putative ABC transport system permease protein